MKVYQTTTGEVVPIPKDTDRCEEASMFSTNFYVPCAKPAKNLVYSQRDTATYVMCDSCADHNVRNRGMKRVIAKEKVS